MSSSSSSSSPHRTEDQLAAPILLGETPEDACPYLPEQQSALAFYKMILPSDTDFDAALARGLRRHGELFYQPICRACRECVPLRVAVESFVPSKSQRRLLRQSAGRYEVRLMGPELLEEHVALFNRHAVMVSPRARTFTDEEYFEFLIQSDVDTRLVEYRVADSHTGRAGDLCGVSVLDLGRTSVSSCYFFWHPAYRDWSPGTFSVLWELNWCQQQGYAHYYLGYWVRDCHSMTYKSCFRPHELFDWSRQTWLPAAPEGPPS